MSNTRSTRTSSSLSSDWTDKENIPVGKLQQQGTKLENGRSNDSLPSNSLDRKRQYEIKKIRPRLTQIFL